MKYKKILIYFFVLIGVFSGCSRPGTPDANSLMDACAIVKINVPFATNTSPGQFDRAREIEQDDFGRRYILYTTYAAPFQCNINIHLMCQMRDDENAFYYKDYCYIIQDDTEESLDTEQISLLKARNDWNKPLNSTKMSSVSIDSRSTNVSYENAASARLSEHLNLNNSYGIVVHSMEMLDAKRRLFFGATFLKETDEYGKNNKFYLFAYENNSVDPIVLCSEFEKSFSCQDAVNGFRMTYEELFKGQGDDSAVPTGEPDIPKD